MSRALLPSRRPNETVTADHAGHRFTVTVGYDASGRPAEVFADGAKIGTDMAHVIADACVVISLALQHGCPAEALVKSLGQVPAWGNQHHPASVVGVIAGVVAGAQAPWVVEADGAS